MSGEKIYTGAEALALTDEVKATARSLCPPDCDGACVDTYDKAVRRLHGAASDLAASVAHWEALAQRAEEALREAQEKAARHCGAMVDIAWQGGKAEAGEAPEPDDGDICPVVIPTPRAHAASVLGWLHGAAETAPFAVRYCLVAAKAVEAPDAYGREQYAATIRSLTERCERQSEELTTERSARARAEAEVDGRGRDLAAAARERDALRAERDETLRRVRVVLDHFGVADCDDPIAALEEVPEIADAVVDDEVAHANELTLQIAALRAIVEGRTTPPTDAEIDAHAKAGGAWHGATPHGSVWSDESPAEVRRKRTLGLTARWWALDSAGRPCAWPTTEVF